MLNVHCQIYRFLLAFGFGASEQSQSIESQFTAGNSTAFAGFRNLLRSWFCTSAEAEARQVL